MTVRARHPETGEIIEVSEEMWEQVYSQQGYSDADATDEKSLHALTREELNALLLDLKPESNPEGMANKGEVITAIEKAQG